MTRKVRGVHNVFYKSFLHPYLTGGTYWGPLDPIVAVENQECEIERSISHKKARGGTIYQVRWIGYDAMEDS